MKVEVSDIKPSIKRLKIEVPLDVLNKEIERAYRNISTSVEIKGFRKGRVPRKVLEQHYSKRIESDVLQRIIPDSYATAIKEHNIRPVDQPQVENIKMEAGEPLSFSITVETLPDITPKDYSHLELTRTIIRVTDKDVENELKVIQELHAELESADDKPIENYDHVILDYEGFLNNVSLKKLKGINHPLFLGTNRFIPEFEKELIGLKKGDSKDIKVVYPVNYPDNELAGKEVQFRVVIKELKKRRLKPLNDDFAKEVSGYKDLEDLKKKVKEDLENNKNALANSRLKNELVGKLVNMYAFELPPSLIEGEIDSMVYNTSRRLTLQGMIDVDKANIDVKEAREGFRDSAVKNLKGRIILEAIAENESVMVGDAELDDEIKRYALSIKENFQVLKRKMEKSRSIEMLKKRMLIDNTLDVIIKKVRVSDIFVDRESEVSR
ncbi:MAG: trigger factor [Nitrospinota bacterium]